MLLQNPCYYHQMSIGSTKAFLSQKAPWADLIFVAGFKKKKASAYPYRHILVYVESILSHSQEHLSCFLLKAVNIFSTGKSFLFLIGFLPLILLQSCRVAVNTVQLLAVLPRQVFPGNFSRSCFIWSGSLTSLSSSPGYACFTLAIIR